MPPKGNPPGGKPPQKAAAPPPARPFRIGVQSHEEINFDQTVTLGASTIDLPVYEIPPAGFLRGVYLLVEATAVNT